MVKMKQENKGDKMIIHARIKYSILLIIPLILLIVLPAISIAEPDSLDAMLATIEKKEKQAKLLEEAKRKEEARKAEEARRKAKKKEEQKRSAVMEKQRIEEARRDAVREDIRKYMKIVSSEYGDEIKEAAWDSLVSRYPASRALAIGDIVGFRSVLRIPNFLISLRSSYRNLSVSQVQSMSNMFILEKDLKGFSGHSTIRHSYSQKSISGDKVVLDHATGLMWHQNGSEWMRYKKAKKAKKWLKKLNRKGYAGYSDWRLPTVEEAASLLESRDRFPLTRINSMFSDEQGRLCTGDKFGSKAVWCISFHYRFCGVSYNNSRSQIGFCVRPVRSMEPEFAINKIL